MDIQQQTKNVAAQGRFGDSMLLHVNPAEVKGLASAVPLTVNPETGQPEAFLPFLAPILGSMGATALAGTGVGAALGLGGLSAGALAGLGAGLATYAQTGGSGSKALLSGLTAGLGTRALQGAAPTTGLDPAIANAQVSAGVGTPIDPSFIGPMAPSSPTTLASQQAAGAAASGTPDAITASLNPAYNTGTAGSSLNAMFTQPGGFDAGMKNLATAAMSPSGMVAGASAGAQGVIASQEEFERQMAQMGLDEEERKRKMYEMYPEQIPMASGGRTGFQPGGQTGEDYPIEDVYIDNYNLGQNPYSYNTGGYNFSGGYSGGNNNSYNNPYQNSSNVFNTPRQRRTRPIGRGFMPGFMPEYSYFEGMNPSATALGYDPLGTSQRDGRSRGIQPMPPGGGFRYEGGPGYTPPPPMFGGYGNPFMQSPSYQGFYGVPQMQQMINPYAAFSQMPMPYQPYQPYTPPVETPPDDSGTPPDDSGGTGGGDVPPPIDIPVDGGFGRKGAVTNPDPIAPPDDFVNPIINPPVGGPVEPPIDGFKTLPYEPPVDYPGGTPGFYDTRPGIQPPGDMDFGGKPGTPPIVTPPPTITIPIEGGADVTIPDYSRPQPPAPVIPPVMAPPMKRPEPPMSIDRIGNYDLERQFDAVPISEPAPTDDMARLSPAQLASIGTPMSQSALDQLAENINMSNGINNQTFYDTGERISQEEALASAIANGAGRPVAPPVQSVTTPQPFLQQPKAPQTGGIPVTGGGPLGSGILPEANLPAGTPPVTGPAQGERQIPSGPAMGGISAVPTPAGNTPIMQQESSPLAPPPTIYQPKSPMSGGIFGAPMFAAGGDTDLPNEGLEALSKTEKGREAVEAMGYQEGGQTDMMQDPVTQDVIMFILGETDNENAINAFVEKYGAEQFMFLRDKILKQAAGNPDAQTEGLIQGDGNSGMADDLPGVIGNKEKIAVSQDEFIVPADVVSMLGDGSSDAGSKQLYNMMDRVRQAKTGGTTQAPPLNPQKVLPA